MFDSWVHEQDMREALDRPGGVTGPAAEASMAQIIGTAGYVVGKKAGAPDGTTVVFELTEPLAQTFAIAVDGGRAKPVDAVPADPTAAHHDRRCDLRARRVRTRPTPPRSWRRGRYGSLATKRWADASSRN